MPLTSLSFRIRARPQRSDGDAGVRDDKARDHVRHSDRGDRGHPADLDPDYSTSGRISVRGSPRRHRRMRRCGPRRSCGPRRPRPPRWPGESHSRRWSTPSCVTTSLSSPRTSMVGTWTLLMAAFSIRTSTSGTASLRPWSMKAGSQCQYHRPSRSRRTLRSPSGFTAPLALGGVAGDRRRGVVQRVEPAQARRHEVLDPLDALDVGLEGDVDEHQAVETSRSVVPSAHRADRPPRDAPTSTGGRPSWSATHTTSLPRVAKA